MNGVRVERENYVVAFINDDPHFLEMVQEVFRTETDHEVVIAKKSEDAIEVLEGALPDVVLLDIVFGSEHSGREVLRKIRKHPVLKQTPVVLCSADSVFIDNNLDEIKALNADWILKPFDIDDLVQKVNYHLGAEKNLSQTNGQS